MQEPSSPRRRTATAAVTGLVAAGLAIAGITVAGASGDGEPDVTEAQRISAVRHEEAPVAHQGAWLDDVAEYVELDAARQYAIGLYARAANWHAAAQYAEALAAAQAAEAAEAATYSGSSGSSTLDAIRACESGGDYGAVSPSGQYRGAYQFDHATWQSVGGSGDPAAASPGEQDMRAQMLYEQSGSSPWPNCG